MTGSKHEHDESVVSGSDAGSLPAPARGTPTNGNYAVGYRKPPKDHQFKKGQSGNPRGRKKADRVDDVAMVIDKVLAEPVTFHDGKGDRTLSTLDALVEKLRLKGLRGERRGVANFLKLVDKAGALTRTNSHPGVILDDPVARASPEQAKIIRGFRAAQAARSTAA